MKFPTHVQLDVAVPVLHAGLYGLIEGVYASVIHQGGELDLDEALVVSTAAFAHYGYDRALNVYAEDEVGCGEGIYFSNFGAFESLGYFTGWHGRDLNGTSDADLWNLVRYEIAGGRPVVSIGFGLDGPVVITGYAESPGNYDVVVTNGTETHVFNMLADKPQGASETFVNMVIPVRQSDKGLVSPDRQALGILRWAATHASSLKEFMHETRENYRPGVAGLLLLAADDRQRDAMARGYSAVSLVLDRWADWLATPALGDAATRFEVLSRALRGEGDVTVDAAARAAYEHLSAAVAGFPAQFE